MKDEAPGDVDEQPLGTEKAKKAKEQEPTDGVDANIFLSTYMMFVYGALSVSLFMKNPEDPRYLYAVLPYPWGEKPQWFFYSWAIMEYLQLIKFCVNFNNILDIVMLYARCVSYWLYELSKLVTFRL